MKTITTTLFVGVLLAACGGSKPPANPTPPADPVGANPEPAAPEPVAKTEPAPAPEPPPPPKVFKAKVELTPIKGQKMKPVAISFTQEEGKQTAVVADGQIEGLKPGKYHLVVHESADCGPNATKAGKPLATAAATVTITVGKDAKAAIETAEVDMSLDGDKSIVGRTIVLHDDKAGKPNKAQACGTIASGDMPAGGAGAGAGK